MRSPVDRAGCTGFTPLALSPFDGTERVRVGDSGGASVMGARQVGIGRSGASWTRRAVTVVVSLLLAAAGTLVTAAPAAAVTPGSGPLSSGVATVAGTVTAVTGGTATYDNTTPGTTTIAVSGPRTIIDFTGLDLAATDTLTFTTNDASDVVVLRVATGTASIGGRLNSYLGTVGGTFGGNVWPFAPAGVRFAGTALVDVGGLVASTGAIADADFLDGDASFSISGIGGSVVAQSATGLAPYPVVRGHGSLVALVGNQVLSASQAQIGAAPGTRTEVLFGSARQASLTLAPRAGGMDLLAFQPAGPGSHGVTVHGPITAADVFVASNAAGDDDTYTTLLGNATANGAVASGDGDVVVAAGGSLSRSSVSEPLRPVLAPTAPAQIFATLGTVRGPGAPAGGGGGGRPPPPPPPTAPMQPVLEESPPPSISGPGGPVTAAGRLVFAAADDVYVNYGTRLSAPSVVVRAGGVFDNLEGSGVVAPATGQWVVYAPRPEDVQHRTAATRGTLDSGRTAIWGGDLDTRPPASITGNRYVFGDPPDITVTADDEAKNYDDAVLTGLPTELTATVAGTLHPGVPGVFLGDTGAVWTGAPDVTSDGAPPTAPERPGGYPIVPSLGTLASPLGYDFLFVDGILDVDDTTPPTVTPHPTGTVGDNGWFTGDAGLTWSIDDPGTIESSITGTGCDPVTLTSDQPKADHTCTGTSLGGTADPVTVTMGRDATPPTLTAASSIGGVAHPEGAWTNTDVRVDYLCSDATSGVATSSPNVDPVTATQTLTGTCTDNAGHTAAVQHQVNIDTVLPTVSDEALRLAGTDTAYVPGTWTDQDVDLTWSCADEGGSGVADGSRSATAGSSGTLQGACRDGAGNERDGQAFAVSIDTVDPAIGDVQLTTGPVGGASTTYAPGSWTRYAVKLSYGCSDEGGSGPVGTGPFGDTLEQSGSLTATCTDRAGNEVTQSFEVLIDDQAPAIGDLALTTEDGAPYTSGDWTTQAVTLAWTCTDGTGGSGAVTGADSVVATGTGPLRAVCTDAAGNSLSSEAFQANIDTVAPELAGIPADRSLTTTGTTATATWTGPTATDDQDTAVDVGCAPASGSSFPVGTTTVTCTATDHAGNTATGDFTVTVTTVMPAATAAFDRPIDSAPVMNIAKLGRVIAVKATVTVGGTAVSGPSAQPVYLGVSSGITCSVSSTSDAIEDYAAGSSVSGNLMQWDAAAQRWTFRVDTGAFAMKPNGCYRVSVYYGGTVTGDRASGGVLAGSFYVQTKK